MGSVIVIADETVAARPDVVYGLFGAREGAGWVFAADCDVLAVGLVITHEIVKWSVTVLLNRTVSTPPPVRFVRLPVNSTTAVVSYMTAPKLATATAGSKANPSAILLTFELNNFKSIIYTALPFQNPATHNSPDGLAAQMAVCSGAFGR